MIEIVGIISLFALIAIAFLKVYNLAKVGQLYGKEHVFITFALAFVFWLLFFFSFAGAIKLETTEIHKDANSNITEIVTKTTNSYIGYSSYMHFASIMLAAVALLTLLELFYVFVPKPLMPKKARV